MQFQTVLIDLLLNVRKSGLSLQTHRRKEGSDKKSPRQVDLAEETVNTIPMMPHNTLEKKDIPWWNLGGVHTHLT